MLVEHNAEFLGQPTVSATGKPIPAADSTPPRAPEFRLSDLMTGDPAEVLHVEASGTAVNFLEAEGLRAGTALEILAVGDNRAMLVQIGDRQVTLAAPIADAILVRRPAEDCTANPVAREVIAE